MFPLRKNKERPVMDAIIQALQGVYPVTKDELVVITGFNKIQINSAIADLIANGEIKPTGGTGYVLYNK